MESSSLRDPIIPPINAYGTFNPSSSRRSLRRSHSDSSSRSSRSSRGQPVLYPSAQPTHNTILSRVSRDLIPFASVFDAVQESIKAFFGRNSEASDMISPSSYVRRTESLVIQLLTPITRLGRGRARDQRSCTPSMERASKPYQRQTHACEAPTTRCWRWREPSSGLLKVVERLVRNHRR